MDRAAVVALVLTFLGFSASAYIAIVILTIILWLVFK